MGKVSCFRAILCVDLIDINKDIIAQRLRSKNDKATALRSEQRGFVFGERTLVEVKINHCLCFDIFNFRAEILITPGTANALELIVVRGFMAHQRRAKWETIALNFIDGFIDFCFVFS